mmetsp:Transcript_8211/g.22277  ORF Transcript_8211/g.22277 Transcript_8211/m.22277 type:complete len:227 (+) Transcript_8211:2921-3601(+)
MDPCGQALQCAASRKRNPRLETVCQLPHALSQFVERPDERMKLRGQRPQDFRSLLQRDLPVVLANQCVHWMIPCRVNRVVEDQQLGPLQAVDAQFHQPHQQPSRDHQHVLLLELLPKVVQKVSTTVRPDLSAQSNLPKARRLREDLARPHGAKNHVRSQGRPRPQRSADDVVDHLHLSQTRRQEHELVRRGRVDQRRHLLDVPHENARLSKFGETGTRRRASSSAA